MTDFEFLDAEGQRFTSESDFFQYIDNEVEFDDIEDNVKLIGSVNDYDSKADFVHALHAGFEHFWTAGDLHFVAAQTGSTTVPYYVYADEQFPVFLTTANITDEMPPTIEQFLRSDPNLGRFWLSMEQVDLLRAELVRQHDDLLIPFFTGHRSEYTEIPAEKRAETERTVSYWGDDGRQAYKEMRTKYGVLPTNIKFKKPNYFTFGIKQEGVFKHQAGSLRAVWDLYRSERQRKERVKEAINTGGYTDDAPSNLFDDRTISASKPWAVDLTHDMAEQPLRNFVPRISEEKREFNVADYRLKLDVPGFDSQIIDDESYGLTRLKGGGDSIRVYPHEGTDIDQHFRIYNFVQDHFDADCRAVEV